MTYLSSFYHFSPFFEPFSCDSNLDSIEIKNTCLSFAKKSHQVVKYICHVCSANFSGFCFRGIILFIEFFSFTAVYSDRTDTSTCPESDSTFTSNSSLISDFGDAPLSSTRRSSFFNASIVNGRPSCLRLSHDNRLADVDRRQTWNDSTSRWASEPPSILSSTRVPAAVPGVEKLDPCADDGALALPTNKFTPVFQGDALPTTRFNRKSVSFRDVDEYFPVFSPDSPKQRASPPFDASEYPGFLHSDRVVAVSQKQGIDVTSPDHVFTFCRESSESTEEDMEKTVYHFALAESDDGDEEEAQVDEVQKHNGKQLDCLPVGGSSSSGGTGSSQYSSCDSDHYKSALDASVHLPAEGDIYLLEASKAKESFLATKRSMDSKPEAPTSELNQLSVEGGTSSAVDAPCGTKVNQLVERAADRDEFDLTFTPSPFVTGRSRSRQSRCSLRTSRTPESLHLTSSLFEETLPTPLRTRRQTPRSQSKESCYSAPRTRWSPGSPSVSLSASSQDTQSSTLGVGSAASQDDTFILPKESQTLSDTVLLEDRQESSGEAYERNLAEVIKAMQAHKLPEEFLTDDLVSSDEVSSKVNGKSSFSDSAADAWISEDASSQPESVSSSSTSSCFSPTRSSGDHDFPCTPGTGCTPRYSMSRLSGLHRPHTPAGLSYTPGGRPLTVEADEPVQYLYTDMEQGHKLVETHVPPTTNTSLSSSMSSTSSGGEDTVIYDWRSMQGGVTAGHEKENQKPQWKEAAGDPLSGMTDRELRLRLVELGESPGPISSRTRPTYMRRLHCLLQESRTQSPHHRKDSTPTQTGEALLTD